MASTNATNTITGYFTERSAAGKAIEELRAAGFNASQTGVALRDTSTTGSTGNVAQKTKSIGNTAADKTEGVWDHIKAFFTGESAEDDKSTRVDPSSEYSNEGYDYEAFQGSLNDLPEEKSRYFSHQFKQGPEGVIVTVKASGREREAEEILSRNGADLGENASSYEYPKESQTENENLQNIQLYGEVLRVHKDRIARGEVVVRKEVITESQTIQVPVTREELVIERRAVSDQKASPGASIGKEKEIRIPLTEERARVEKEPVVREEVRVGKRSVQNVQTLDDQVRHEELEVDNNIDHNKARKQA